MPVTKCYSYVQIRLFLWFADWCAEAYCKVGFLFDHRGDRGAGEGILAV